MDNLFQEKLLLLYQNLHAFDSQQADRLDRWRNLEPESAEFLSILIRTKQAKNVLEIGTSNGYSTLWIADALEMTDGFLTSLEIDQNRTLLAQQYLQEFKLDHRANLITIDAAVFLENPTTVYDVIFLDAERTYYTSYWPALQKLLLSQAGSILIVDNVISHQEQVEDLISLIESDSNMMKTILPVGAGLLVVTKA